MPLAGSHWEYFRPLPQDSSLYMPYYKKITIHRKGGGDLQYRIVEEPNSNPHWSVFVQFPQAEDSIHAEVVIPDHDEMSVHFNRGQGTFKLPDRGGTEK
jgi:hypothetical protein